MESRIVNRTPIGLGDALRWMLLYIAALVPPSVVDLLLLGGLSAGARMWASLAMHAVLQGLYLWALMRRRGIRFQLLAGFSPKAFGLAVAGAAFCVALVSFGVGPVLQRLAARSTAAYDDAMQPFVQSPVAGFLFICVLGPLVEELLARGFVLGGLAHRYGAVGALLISTALFAAMHMNVMQAITALVPGFVLGHLYLHTGSLLSCILMHAMYNAVSFFAMLHA